jgi:hypothetical protein
MLTLQIVPYAQIADLSSVGRIRKLLTIAKQEKIVLLQGRLRKEEEAELIKATMEEINKDFKGIELAVVEDKKTTGFGSMVSTLLLGNRSGFTIIGPANIVKSIKKDPTKIELLMNDKKKKKR